MTELLESLPSVICERQTDKISLFAVFERAQPAML